jgi:acetyl esterase/lipase
MRDEIVVDDVVYARHGRTAPLRARIYHSSGGRTPAPALVSMHGGIWHTGDRTQDHAFHERIAAAGIIVMSLDTRMPPEVRHPAPMLDLTLGIRWFKSHAREYRSMPGLVGGIGFSSGGHQMMLAALRPSDPRLCVPEPDVPETVDARLSFVIAIHAIFDPLARYRMAQELGLKRILDGHHAYWPSEESMEQDNPTRILYRHEQMDLPPTLIIQGNQDSNVPPATSTDFAAAYAAAGGQVDLHVLSDAPHGYLRDPERYGSPACLDTEMLIRHFAARFA